MCDATGDDTRKVLAEIKQIALTVQPNDVPNGLAHIIRLCIDADRALSRPDAGGGVREALKFYASESQVNSEGDSETPGLSRSWVEPTSDLFDDGGRKARAALHALSTPSDAVNESAEAPQWPANLHPLTLDLVKRFAVALAEKLCLAEEKYGYSDNWQRDDWKDDCQHKLIKHIAKGDPRDVAAYCAFMWHHGWPTVILDPDELAGCREVLREATVKNAKQSAMIADLNDMVLRYAHLAETNASAEALELAYGLLWIVGCDRSTTNGNALYLARKALYERIDKDGQARGITAARKALADNPFHNLPDPVDTGVFSRTDGRPGDTGTGDCASGAVASLHNDGHPEGAARSDGLSAEARLREALVSVMAQAESDLAGAHAEICKLQNLDPAQHAWPEWSPQANTLRWFKTLRDEFSLANQPNAIKSLPSIEIISALLYEAANPTMKWSYLWPSHNHLHASVRQRYIEAAARFEDAYTALAKRPSAGDSQ